jgi:hypothetical protein
MVVQHLPQNAGTFALYLSMLFGHVGYLVRALKLAVNVGSRGKLEAFAPVPPVAVAPPAADVEPTLAQLVTRVAALRTHHVALEAECNRLAAAAQGSDATDAARAKYRAFNGQLAKFDRKVTVAEQAAATLQDPDSLAGRCRAARLVVSMHGLHKRRFPGTAPVQDPGSDSEDGTDDTQASGDAESGDEDEELEDAAHDEASHQRTGTGGSLLEGAIGRWCMNSVAQEFDQDVASKSDPFVQRNVRCTHPTVALSSCLTPTPNPQLTSNTVQAQLTAFMDNAVGAGKLTNTEERLQALFGVDVSAPPRFRWHTLTPFNAA